MKYILIVSGAAALLSLVIIAVALIVIDDNDYRKLAVWGVEHLTGYRMIVEDPFLVDLSAEPSLTADGIRFEAFGGDPSPRLASIGRLHLKIALKPLLWGIVVFERLQIEDVSVDTLNLREKYRAESRWDNLVPDFLFPVFESVTLENINLSVEDRNQDRKIRFHLNRFRLTMFMIADPFM
jgi:uncharacterized protein involved in outer membrane biogenesis